MRSDIHKLKPQNLEETIIENPTSHPRTNGPNEIQIGDWRGLSTLICMDETYRILLSISQAMFTKNNFSFSLRQCSCIILQMNNGIIWKQSWLTIKMDLQMINQKWSFTYLMKIGWMMSNLEFLWICLTIQHRSCYCCMQVEEQEKLLLHVKSLRSWPDKMKFVVARVQPGLALCTRCLPKFS